MKISKELSVNRFGQLVVKYNYGQWIADGIDHTKLIFTDVFVFTPIKNEKKWKTK